MVKSTLAPQKEESRDIDPNVRQRRASDPAASVWAAASAGTGKTKVLTDRVLRLLLPEGDGRSAARPERILGLTFTKAAAAEMVGRINERLSRWAIAPDTELQEDLESLTGNKPSQIQMSVARQLFAQVVDTPGGLKIMTIHAFCQSVLGRFPLESGLSPHFKVIEEAESAEILSIAQNHVFENARSDPQGAEGQMITRIAQQQNEQQFSNLLSTLSNERGQMEKVFAEHGSVEGIHKALCRTLGVREKQTPEGILEEFCSSTDLDITALRATCIALSQGSKTDQERVEGLQKFLDADVKMRILFYPAYRSALLTQKDEPRKISAKVLNQNPEISLVLDTEAERIFDMEDQQNAVQMAGLTRDLLKLGHIILERYENEKTRRGVLDYTDLILRTLRLLEGRGDAAWVMFKLDGGLDHILVDEAQDTNPEQWKIIARLCEDFFSGQGQKEDTLRTVFAVGDEKQSIYSFQRAAPEEFESMRGFFAEKINAANLNWRDEKLNISFRSTKSVLQVVDAVFADPAMRKGLGHDLAEHISFRRGQAGLVEIWPLFEEPEKTQQEPWSPPTQVMESPSAHMQLADHIAKKIQHWIENKEILLSQGRGIEAGDIMILVRTRTRFMTQIVRALKNRGVPVSGVDRMVLNDQLVIQDLLGLAQFTQLPEDDLSLACVLKSPFIGLSEEQLYDVTIDRTGSLWSALQNSKHKAISLYLADFIQRAAQDHPYEFFMHALHAPCPADSQSGMRAIRARLGEDALDPLEEFLSAALHFERSHIPTLQGFVHWQTRSQADIKREQEEAGGKVRVMTIHGAKGLQAPIVILPDTTRHTRLPPGQSNYRLLWPDKTGLDVPLWAPRKDCENALYRDGLSRYQDKQDEEYRRLLYVAMTRAEDRLYVAGCQGRRTPLENSWYFALRRAMKKLPETEQDGEFLRLTNPQMEDLEEGRNKIHSVIEKSEATVTNDFPVWGALPIEPSPPRPLIPSRPSQADQITASPLSGADTYRFRRGNITHALLQYLPDLPESKRKDAAQRYVARPGHGITEDMGQSIVGEVMAILNHEEFAPVFGPESIAEVPVTGLLSSGTLISGQIDRLLVREDGLWIIDYKSNRPAPTREQDVPEIYRTQMKAYRDALSLIYPDRPIHCALLWTDGPRLMTFKTL